MAKKRKRKNKLTATSKAVAIALPLLLFSIAAILSMSGNKNTNTSNSTSNTSNEAENTASTKNEPSTQNGDTQTVSLYFIDRSNTLTSEQAQIPVDSSMSDSEKKEELVKNVAALLKRGPNSNTLFPSIPENVTIKRVHLPKGDEKADIYMSEEYLSLSLQREVLLYASLIYTFTGLDFISEVKIFAGDQELTDADGQPLGYRTADSIVMNEPIVVSDSAKERTFALYFSNYDVTYLDKEERVVKVNPNQKLELIVVEQIIKGPEQEGILFPTVPPETKVKDVYTKDGVCYLDLSSDFISKHQGGSTADMLAAYSIVNSLTELNDIKKVQFLFDGKKISGFEHIDLSKPLERNLGV